MRERLGYSSNHNPSCEELSHQKHLFRARYWPYYGGEHGGPPPMCGTSLFLGAAHQVFRGEDLRVLFTFTQLRKQRMEIEPKYARGCHLLSLN